jgi:site-specific recombinase XerD
MALQWQPEIDTKALNLSPLSLRHFTAILLTDNGYSAEKIWAGLGWSNDSTRQCYTHITADGEQTKIIDGVFEKKRRHHLNFLRRNFVQPVIRPRQ